MTQASLSTPRRQDAWLWRLCATALAFTLFGLGGLVLRVLVFPLMSLLPGDAATRQHRARATITRAFRGFINFMKWTGILTVDFRGAEHLGQPGQMIIANHPSLLDVVFLIGHVDAANCVIKHVLLNNVFTRGPVSSAGYISNNESLDMLDQAADVLRTGQTLIVFPEGTRTPRDAMPQFHRGACAIALRGARLVTPVVIRMEPRSLTKGEPWYRIPYKRMHYSLHVGPSLDPALWLAQHPLPIAGRKMNDHLHDYFAHELTRS